MARTITQKTKVKAKRCATRKNQGKEKVTPYGRKLFHPQQF